MMYRYLLLLGFISLNSCSFLHISTPLGSVNVGAIITPGGRVGINAGTRVGNVAIGGATKTVDVFKKEPSSPQDDDNDEKQSDE